ncbi:MAG: RagB/SusD family nutrient uptake outer membrane protein [Candidatus Cryptobacteroides sp.]
MKNILKYTLAVGMAVSMFASCDLDLTPTTAIAYEEGGRLFISANDIKTFENGIMASYRALQYGDYTQTSEVQTDYFNATLDYGNNYGSTHRCDASFTPGTYEPMYMWRDHYTAIKNYNIVIANADNVDASLKVSARILKGEAFFLRASSYIILARHFAKAYNPSSADNDLCVPLVLKYNQLEKPARATNKAVYEQIKADLDSAAAILAVVPGKVRAQKPTIDAVNALYARYYLDTRNYAQAAASAEAVISSAAGYALASTEEEMALEYTDDAGTEPIIQLFANKTEGARGNTIYTSVSNSQEDGKYFSPYFLPTKALVESYNATDLRFLTWFSNDLYPVRSSGSYYTGVYVMTKYLDNPSLHEGKVETGAHYAKPLMIGEMYLIAAEAYAQAGNSAKATEVLNVLQDKRKAPATQGSMENIKKEWYKETVGEGLRFSCVKRWGEGFAVRTPQAEAKNLIMSGDYYEKRTLSADSYFLNWPVPSYEIQLNKNLVQNAGYTTAE